MSNFLDIGFKVEALIEASVRVGVNQVVDQGRCRTGIIHRFGVIQNVMGHFLGNHISQFLVGFRKQHHALGNQDAAAVGIGIDVAGMTQFNTETAGWGQRHDDIVSGLVSQYGQADRLVF